MSDATVLTFDLGNSFIKGLCCGAKPDAAVRISWEGDWERELGRWLAALPPHSHLIPVSSVVEELRLAHFVRACEGFGFPLQVNPAPALDVDCRSPETIGKDRLYAALGAWDLAPLPAIVLDAGTAMTVDALGVRAGRPCFLGGSIAPGPKLLAASLSSGAAQLYAPELEGDLRALGRDTGEALRAGVLVGFQGAARELVRRIAIESDLANARLLLSGGARGILRMEGLFGEREVIEEEHLVHRGLRACPGS